MQHASSQLLAFLGTPQKHPPSTHFIDPAAALQQYTSQTRRDVVQGSEIFGQVRTQCLEYNMLQRGEGLYTN